ncbi:hypothetical protein LTR05_007975 [Lithohypha guttulata]|uniref:Cytochrome b561 domain-containing protein n=1 Tax=Lithohypha guttulata TaxID=1690604 RepID=A0AAN7STK0_9EURO|nr:hypothetical protein LTR05_007975 [Lithohypha guttulata]
MALEPRQLAPPGSSTYNSDTMHVGDGTWDAGRDSFLLPNLVGFNFATMRYNGMGNRFLTMEGYHGLVKAHGILAAITFLLVIPAAIFFMRFNIYRANPRRGAQLHVWLQILALFLATAVLILGCFQVGRQRSLTNPHHGIGVAIYVLLWVQFIFGVVLRRIDRGRPRKIYVPLKAMLHHWLGRAIALLGIVQVALGLTLYGSPLFLFILYAFWVFLLVLLYFILQWRHEKRKAQIASGRSHYSEEVITQQRPSKHTGFGKLATAGAAGAGLAALFNRRSKPKRRYSESDLTYTSRSSSSSYLNEKPGRPQNRAGFGQRILQVGAIGGGLAAAKSLFGRRKAGRDDESEIEPYRPPLGGHTSIMSDSISRLEEGRPPRPVTPPGGGLTGMAAVSGARPAHPLAQPPMTPGSGRPSDEYSYYDYMSSSPSRQGRHQTFKQAVAAGGAMYAVRQLFKGRRQKKEEERADDLRHQRIEEEKVARMNSKHKYAGDGTTPPRRPRHNRLASQTASDVSSLIEGSVQRPGMSGMSSGVPVTGTAGAAAASALSDRSRIRPVGADPPIAPPGPPSAMVSDLPPVPPPHGTDIASSGSELYTTASGRQRYRHHPGAETAAVAGGATLAAATLDPRRRRQEDVHTDSLESPPVSIHVKTQDNGRKVTLRRLTEEEAAAQRAARRQERRASRRRRNSSFSSSGGEGLGPDDRWRRNEQIEAAQQAALDHDHSLSTLRPSTAHIVPSEYPTPPPPGTQAIDPQTGATYAVPMPPPIPASTSHLAGPAGSVSVTSPGTETSGPSEYANNRRRRRAERAQARIAREGRGGASTNTVDFT